MKTLFLTNPPVNGARTLQQALIKDGFLPVGSDDDVYGPLTARACEKAKWKFGYPSSAIHHGHEYAGDQLLDYLTGRTELPVAYQRRRRQRLGGVPNHDAAVRQSTVSAFEWIVANAEHFRYAQDRPIPLFHGPIPPGRVIATDCTGAITLACYRGGAPDPNNLHYGGQGFTGTMLGHLTHIPRSEAKPADLVVWVNPHVPTGHHGAMLIHAGSVPDPMLCSFGSNPPRKIALSAETAAQASFGATQTNFLRLRTS